MRAARLDEARLMDAQQDQRVEELDTARPCASLLMRRKTISDCRQAQTCHAPAAPSVHRQHASA
jgi:hypothetical protein